MSSIEDEFLGCSETPVWLPRTDFRMDSIQVCKSCKVRLTSKIAGPGNVSASPEGLIINENPTVTLTFNGAQHNLIQTTMSFPATHRLADLPLPSEAEILFYFQNYTEYNKILCVALPLTIGDSESSLYFASLGTGITPNRPTMTTLFGKDDVFLTYRGADLRSRTADTPRPRDRCDPVQTVITYILSTKAATISWNDYNRLLKISGENRENCNKHNGRSVQEKEAYAACKAGPWVPAAGGPPKPRTDVTINRIVKLASRINGIILEDNRTKKSSGDGLTTKSLKCYKLNPSKDIQGDKVFVGGKDRPGIHTLEDELAAAAAHPELSEAEINAEKSSIKPKDIEGWIGLIVGIVVGLVVCATVIVFLWRRTFVNYGGVQKLYNNPISASQIAPNVELPKLPTICPPK